MTRYYYAFQVVCVGQEIVCVLVLIPQMASLRGCVVVAHAVGGLHLWNLGVVDTRVKVEVDFHRHVGLALFALVKLLVVVADL